MNRHEEAGKALSYFHWSSLLIPIFAFGCGILWVHALNTLQINSLRKMRKEFLDCIDMANASIGLAPGRQHIVCCRANDKFDRISELYAASWDATGKRSKKFTAYMDLQFIFSLNNNMKKEYEQIGLVIQKGFLVRIPKKFQRSVSNYKCAFVGFFFLFSF